MPPADSSNAPCLVQCDVIIVGAGLSGISALHRLRNLGLKTKVFESAPDFGGVWYWNRYPGARVDSETPFYQLNIPEIWKTWSWSCRFPAQEELLDYVHHCDKVLGLRKDVYFNAEVVAAQYHEAHGIWTVKTGEGHVATAKYLILAVGLLHSKYLPMFPGLDQFAGSVYHSSNWPRGFSATGKKVAILGAGATSVQIVQELAKTADHMSVLIRRPSYCLPMRQRSIDKEEQTAWKAYYPTLFDAGRKSYSGFPGRSPSISIFEVDSREREAYFEELWERGAFNFLICQYEDVMVDKQANKLVYDFWARKTRARMSDQAKKDLMAPLEPPYWFGTKRCPLENDYYEMLDKAHVDVVDLNRSPITEFVNTGVYLQDGRNLEFDTLVLATGFDSFTGSLTQMGLKNKHGIYIKDVWKDGISTYMGVFCHGFPNAFFVATAQAPTVLSNGPTIIETQVDLIVESIAKLEKENAKSLEATKSAEERWSDLISEMNDHTLFPLTDSWWTGGNIPGKKAQALTFIGGIDLYIQICRTNLENWMGFDVSRGASFTWEPAIINTIESQALLRHFLEQTAAKLVAREPHDNPLLTCILPWACSETIIIDAMIALSGADIGHKVQNLALRSATIDHYLAVTRKLKHALTNWDPSEAQNTLRLLSVTVFLCQYEALTCNGRSVAYYHLRASREFIKTIFAAGVGSLSAQEFEIFGFLLEYYVYLAIVCNVTIGGNQNTEVITTDWFVQTLQHLQAYPTFGSLLGSCWELYELIPVIQFLPKLEDEPWIETYSSLEERILNWPPTPPTKPEGPLQARALTAVGRIYQLALLAFLYSACYVKYRNKEDFCKRMAPIIVEFRHLCGHTCASPLQTTLLWPLMVIGSCLTSSEDQQEMCAGLSRSRFDWAITHRALEILKMTWELHKDDIFGPFALGTVVKSHDFCVS
ncbi:hypothetical protein AYO22_11373 [Fonsecaea multimorphosa]|nr:hypothetical protein AYO22_11373 [Fonsecaea multimorphosa]